MMYWLLMVFFTLSCPTSVLASGKRMTPGPGVHWSRSTSINCEVLGEMDTSASQTDILIRIEHLKFISRFDIRAG